MSEVEIYTGTLIGPHGTKVGRWVRFEDYSNATGGQEQAAPNQAGISQHEGIYGMQMSWGPAQAAQNAKDQEEGLKTHVISNGGV